MSKPPRFVYFMKPIGMDGPIKIGCSDIPMQRLEALSVWSPFPLEIITTTPGRQADERFLHGCFAYCHLHREWFQPSQLLLETIDAISTGTTIAELRLRLTETGNIRTAARRARKSGPKSKIGLFWEPLFVASGQSEAA